VENLNKCLAQGLRTRPTAAKSRRNAGFSFRSTVKPRSSMGALRQRGRTFSGLIPLRGLSGTRQKRKTRPGGQPDGSSHMGAWGGWALAPNTASMGRDNSSHTHWSRKGRRTFKPLCDFFNFLAGTSGRKFIARRDWVRLRRTCRTPWTLGADAIPWSREHLAGPELFRRQAGPKPWLPAPRNRRR
jgi:hypothetical protein